MSAFYKYTFISPASLYASIKEELKSYFDTGSLDDTMFPTYTSKCLSKLGKGSLPIKPTVIKIENYQGRLPDNFFAVREAWLCAEVPYSGTYTSASGVYTQTIQNHTYSVFPLLNEGCNCPNPPCDPPSCGNPTCSHPNTCCGGCEEEVLYDVHKTVTEMSLSYRQTFLLKPGNIIAREKCDLQYGHNMYNPYSSTSDSFDIHGNQFVTNFKEGIVFLLFYAEDFTEGDDQLVPNNYRILEYIEAFIKYKMFETLFNQSANESFNQLQSKFMFYKQQMEEAYVMAESEMKKQDTHTKLKRISALQNRLGHFRRL